MICYNGEWVTLEEYERLKGSPEPNSANTPEPSLALEPILTQEVDNLQVESFLRQQEINDKISTYQDETRFFVSPALVPELQNQVEFLRQQYQQLQEIKYKLEPEALDNLMTDSLLEQQRMRTAIETKEAEIIDAQRELEEDADKAIEGSLRVNILIKEGQIKVMTGQIEFLTKQYQQLEELRYFITK